MGYYHIAQICKNGHMINSEADSSPELNENFCTICGAETIMNCPQCGAYIQGHYEVPNVWIVGEVTPVNYFCHNCGKPYPWTESALLAASALLYEAEEISDDLKDRTVESLKDVVAETPYTTLAVTRLKKCMMSAGKFTSDALRQFVIDFGCELARRTLGL